MSNITWAQYGIFMSIATLLYYVVVILLYYRNSIPAISPPAGFEQRVETSSKNATNGNEFIPTLENSFIEKKVVSMEGLQSAFSALDFQATENNDYNGKKVDDTPEAAQLLNETEFELPPDLLRFIAGENSGGNAEKMGNQTTPYTTGEVAGYGDDAVSNVQSAAIEAIASPMNENQQVLASDIAITASFQEEQAAHKQEKIFSNMPGTESIPGPQVTTDTWVQEAHPISGSNANTNEVQTGPQKDKDSILHLVQKQKNTNK